MCPSFSGAITGKNPTEGSDEGGRSGSDYYSMVKAL